VLDVTALYAMSTLRYCYPLLFKWATNILALVRVYGSLCKFHIIDSEVPHIDTRRAGDFTFAMFALFHVVFNLASPLAMFLIEDDQA